MRLVDLNPQFLDSNHFDKGIALMCDCPCGCEAPLYVPFRNPIGGARPVPDEDASLGRAMWERDGDTFDTLTLRPSIHRDPAKGGCGWHGHIISGEVSPC